jgi:hypothetical protein
MPQALQIFSHDVITIWSTGLACPLALPRKPVTQVGTDMSYSVERIEEARESFGPYRCRILRDGDEVAIFVHDFRGECAQITTCDGREEVPPFGMFSEFLTGGGRLPLGLTKKAKAYLDALLDIKKKAQPTGAG